MISEATYSRAQIEFDVASTSTKGGERLRNRTRHARRGTCPAEQLEMRSARCPNCTTCYRKKQDPRRKDVDLQLDQLTMQHRKRLHDACGVESKSEHSHGLYNSIREHAVNIAIHRPSSSQGSMKVSASVGSGRMHAKRDAPREKGLSC